MRRRKRIGGRRIALAVLGAALLAVTSAGAALAGSGAGSNEAALVQAARATAKYNQVAVAKGAGYALLKDKKGIACIAMTGMPGMGAMGIHYAKGPLVGDGKIAVSTPEAVIYQPEAGGKLKLVAIEYVVLKSAWDAHHASAPSLFGKTFNFTPAGNRFGLPAYYSLHAWIWKNNPSGEFSMWNPSVSCKAA